MMTFSSWRNMEDDPDHDGPAVYLFRLVENGIPVPLGRMLTTDPEGILVIGCTGRMIVRCQQSRSARRYASGSSTMNWLYSLEHYSPLLTIYPNAEYEFCFAMAEALELAKAWKETLMKQYWSHFGELPPLNSKMPNRYHSYDNLGTWKAATILISDAED